MQVINMNCEILFLFIALCTAASNVKTSQINQNHISVEYLAFLCITSANANYIRELISILAWNHLDMLENKNPFQMLFWKCFGALFEFENKNRLILDAKREKRKKEKTHEIAHFACLCN